MADKERDLKDVVKQQSRRGRRPIDIEAVRKRSELAPKLLTLTTEKEFAEAMHAFGPAEGTEEFSAALDAWRGFRS